MKNRNHPAHTTEALVVGAALMVLLAATIVAYLVDLGPAGDAVALAIAAAKAALVAAFYMDLRRHRGAVLLPGAAGLIWLAIMITLTLADFLTRT
jgi:cytochrome c oxidase subunit 4